MAGEFSENQLTEYKWTLSKPQWERHPPKYVAPQASSDGLVLTSPEATVWAFTQLRPGRYTFVHWLGDEEGALEGRQVGIDIQGTSTTYTPQPGEDDSQTVLLQLKAAMEANSYPAEWAMEITVRKRYPTPPLGSLASQYEMEVSIIYNGTPTVAGVGAAGLDEFDLPATEYSIKVYASPKDMPATGPQGSWALVGDEAGVMPNGRYRVSALDKTGLLGDALRIYVQTTIVAPANGVVYLWVAQGAGASS